MHLALLLGLLSALAGGASDPHSYALAQVSGGYSIAAQATTTATAALTATASVTATTVVNTPVPLPTVGPQGSFTFRNPFDWTFLTSAPTPPLGIFGWAYLVTMLVLFAVSAYFYFFKRIEWKRTNPVLRRAADRWGSLGLWISAIALLFVAFRVASLDFFNLRFWFYLWLLAAIVIIAWLYYWYRTAYPKQLAKYHKTQRAKQYMPSSTKKGQSRQIVTPQRATNAQPSNPQTEKKRKRR